MDQQDRLREEISEIRSGGLLGRSQLIRRLFDYLADCSLEGRSPKETEVATEVFGRRPDFDAGQDAVARVYMHKLRRRLEVIYAGPRADARGRLIIPLGEYRLVAEPVAPEPGVAAIASPASNAPLRWWLAAAALLLVMMTIGGVLAVQQALLPPAVREVRTLRAGPVWAPLLSNNFPTLVAVGDYYIFGDSDDGMETARLVREYSVNSSQDLDDFLMRHPAKMGHYLDLDLRYLPVGSATALRDVLPMIEPDARSKPVRVVLSSELTPNMLKTNNIVYLGYLSGLGVLRNPVFAGSRFTVGQTYDELIDSLTHTRYVSQGGGPATDGELYRDYGYFSTFSGPSGNRIVVIVGTRDVALMQTAEAATHASLNQTLKTAGRPDTFEALYRVDGMSRQNVGGKLLLASPLEREKIWDEGANQKLTFPAG